MWGFGAATRRVLSVLAPVLNVYPPSTTFYEDNQFKGIKGDPEKHIRAFFELAKIIKAKDSIPKIAFPPLRSSCMPVNTKINATILCAQRLASVSTTNAKLEDMWGQALDMSSKPMQTTNGKKFSGVSISIHKETGARKQAKLDKGQASGAARKAINARNATMAVKVTPAIAKVVEQIADDAVDYIPDAATYADKAVKLMKRKRAEPKNAVKWADKALEAAVAFGIRPESPAESLLAQARLDEDLITYIANTAAGCSILQIENLGMYEVTELLLMIINTVVELSDDAAAASKPPPLKPCAKTQGKTQTRRGYLCPQVVDRGVEGD
ncbi:hypothetical protein BX667DRAFT_537406 [Coemansia mojavensis]|nr:hypothetical protein BX667DRAFT_537406 [Coemansia mojavensis]